MFTCASVSCGNTLEVSAAAQARWKCVCSSHSPKVFLSRGSGDCTLSSAAPLYQDTKGSAPVGVGGADLGPGWQLELGPMAKSTWKGGWEMGPVPSTVRKWVWQQLGAWATFRIIFFFFFFDPRSPLSFFMRIKCLDLMS